MQISVRPRFCRVLLSIIWLFCFYIVKAQPNTSIRLDYKDKPTKYEMKVLPAEKSGEGELHGLKKLMQGTYTHFNYLFNANKRLVDALAMARKQKIDNYNQLITFDNYDTAVFSHNIYLDTAIQKGNGALLLHDIRNEWTDEVYLILGKSYYYKGLLDTAEMHFQYLNYAFAPKDDGYDLPMVSNITNKDGNTVIASPKKKGFLKHAPRRNEGLLWLVRTLIMRGHIATAEEILQLLRDDSQFPKNLLEELNDCYARAFYFSKQYDSAAVYLLHSMKVAADGEDKARRHFLIGQLFQLSHQDSLAAQSFDYAANHTSDILMEITARLNISDIENTANNSSDQLDKLLKLSKKWKYKDYQSMIYYLLGEKYLQKNDSASAFQAFVKGAYLPVADMNGSGAEYKNRNFQKLGDISEQRFQFPALVAAYDSIRGNMGQGDNHDRMQQRKVAVANLGKYLKEINTEDSLQMLSNLPEKQQEKILKDHIRKIRRQLGLKDQPENMISNGFNGLNNNNAPTDLFSGNTNESGSWYFNNNDVKAQGYQSFVTRYGQRPNVDNWIRQSAVRNAISNQNSNMAAGNNDGELQSTVDSSKIDLTFLKNQLLNTPEKLNASRKKMVSSALNAGMVLETQLEDYPGALWFYKKALELDSSGNSHESLFYHMATSNYAMGDKESAKKWKEQLQHSYPQTKYFQEKSSANDLNSAASEKTEPGKMYAQIYHDFLSGSFKKAQSEKQKADSIYGNSYWTPQLLYIESIYYVSERQDSAAITKLNVLKQRFPKSPIKEKAETMLDVLARRTEIETYLTNLQITKLEDTDEVFYPKSTASKIDFEKKKEIEKVSDTAKQVIAAKTPIMSIPKLERLVKDSSNNVVKYVIDVDKPHYVMIVLEKVAKVFATEAGNAFNRFNKQNYYNQELPIQTEMLDETHYLDLIGPFKDAGDAYLYIDKVSPVTPQRILPWLTKDKYKFSMISNDNLELLRKTKTLADYQKLLHDTFPGKF